MYISVYMFHFTASLSVDMAKKRDAFNNSGNIIDKPMKSGKKTSCVPYFLHILYI